MTETKFSGGPWVAHYAEGIDGEMAGWMVLDDRSESSTSLIADVEEGADAHLIAAAPDLYEALNDMVRMLGADFYGTTIDAAKAALAKARGET